MLSDRITELFRLIHCSNTEIARWAGCSPSNISRLKSGQRTPEASSHTVFLLCKGIYLYAQHEGLLGYLCRLCHADGESETAVIPAVRLWLFDNCADYAGLLPAVPRSLQKKHNRNACFGELLDKTMRLLGLSNVQVASGLNVDASLISCYRNGKKYPHKNERIKDCLCELILNRAVKNGQIHELSLLSAIPGETLNALSLRKWLFETDDLPSMHIAQTLLHNFETFVPQNETFPAVEIPDIKKSPFYWGASGLKKAVIRFLSEAKDSAGELLLFSDEPMTWMSSSPEYFSLWAALMSMCLQNGVRIKIIHNINRSASEMINAVTGWFPLYISGQIEPYVLCPSEHTQFFHTLFINCGHSCIHGSYPAGSGENRWYEYITDPKRLSSLQAGFTSMLSAASCFLKTYSLSNAQEYQLYYENNLPEKPSCILYGLSVETMPEELFMKILKRTVSDRGLIDRAAEIFRHRKKLFETALENGEVNEIIYLPDKNIVLSDNRYFIIDADLADIPFLYSSDDLDQHIAAIISLMENSANYHLTVLPFAPFQNIQVYILKNAVSILRRSKPCRAFVFTNDLLHKAVSEYAQSLADNYYADRKSISETLHSWYSDSRSL